MNSSRLMPDDETLDEMAAQWLCERDEGFTPEQAAAFARWCALDPRNAAAVRRVEHTLQLLGELPAVRRPLEQRIRTSSSEHETAARSGSIITFRRLIWLGGIAAVFLIVLGLAGRRRPAGPAASPILHYTTDRTVQQSVALPDGSVMDINVDSDVAVQFTDRARRITLERGEAHFQVAHNPARPFVVAAGNVDVRAVGTAFEVRLTPDAVDVVVVEGRVELGRSASLAAPAPAAPPPLLSAGEHAQLTRSAVEAAPKIQGIDAASIQSLLTWRTPMASFTNVPLSDVITRLNRRNPTQLALADTELGRRKIGGTIALDQVDAFVRLLEQDGDILADRTTPGLITLRRAR